MGVLAMPSRGPLKLVTPDTPDDEMPLSATVPTGAPPKPEGLSPAASDLWDQLVPALDELGLVAIVDGLTIDLYLRHYLAALQAADELAEAESIAIADDAHGRLQKHPADAVFRMHSDLALKYGDRLGTSFAARARLLSTKGSDDGEGSNPFEPPTPATTGSG